MTWALLTILAAYSGWLHFRLRKLSRDLRRLDLIHHEAGNRAIRRNWRDQWRWRETVSVLEIMINWTATPADVPDLAKGPTDNPESE